MDMPESRAMTFKVPVIFVALTVSPTLTTYNHQTTQLFGFFNKGALIMKQVFLANGRWLLILTLIIAFLVPVACASKPASTTTIARTTAYTINFGSQGDT
jgi:hypothetical protein